MLACIIRFLFLVSVMGLILDVLVLRDVRMCYLMCVGSVFGLNCIVSFSMCIDLDNVCRTWNDVNFAVVQAIWRLDVNSLFWCNGWGLTTLVMTRRCLGILMILLIW